MDWLTSLLDSLEKLRPLTDLVIGVATAVGTVGAVIVATRKPKAALKPSARLDASAMHVDVTIENQDSVAPMIRTFYLCAPFTNLRQIEIAPAVFFVNGMFLPPGRRIEYGDICLAKFKVDDLATEAEAHIAKLATESTVRDCLRKASLRIATTTGESFTVRLAREITDPIAKRVLLIRAPV